MYQVPAHSGCQEFQTQEGLKEAGERWGRADLLTEGTSSEFSLKDLILNLATSTCLQLSPEMRKQGPYLKRRKACGEMARSPGPFVRYPGF